MGFKDAMRNMIGLEDDNEEIITQEEIDAAKKDLNKSETDKSASDEKKGFNIKADSPYESIAPMISRAPQGKNYSMNGSGPFKMLVIEPKNFDECTKLVDNLKSRKPVIINLEKVETDLARKMFDFLSGATYALNGTVQRVTSNIFIFAPENVDIAAKLNRENTETGYSENRSPWR